MIVVSWVNTPVTALPSPLICAVELVASTSVKSPVAVLTLWLMLVALSLLCVRAYTPVRSLPDWSIDTASCWLCSWTSVPPPRVLVVVVVACSLLVSFSE